MKKLVRKVKKRLKKPDSSTALVPTESSLRITNTTVAKHREEVLGQARKFRMPLAHSRHKIVWWSISIAVGALLFVFTFSLFLLYGRQSYSRYAYQFTKLFPVPVARVDGSFVPYEDYLFELRSQLHYKVTQENLDLQSADGKSQVAGVKQQALDKVIADHYVQKKANKAGVQVTGEDIDNQIALLQEYKRLGADNAALDNILQRYFDWDQADFRRSLHIQLTKQKYLSHLEGEKLILANEIVTRARGGEDFSALAKQYSNDDATKEGGGQLAPIGKDNHDVPLNFLDTIFELNVGDVSEPIETPFGIEVVKITKKEGETVELQHILLAYRNLDEIVQEELKTASSKRFIKLSIPEISEQPAGLEAPVQ